MDQRKRLTEAYSSGKRKPASGISPNSAGDSEEVLSSGGKPEVPGGVPVKGSGSGSDQTPLRGFLKVGGANGYRKAAKFLLLLGKREAADVLKHFSDKEIQEITREIASIKKIEHEEASKILKEFGYLRPGLGSSKGGVEVARSMLQAAFGEEKGNAVFQKVIPFNGEKPFAFLEDLEFTQLIMILRKEPVHVLAIILSFLDPSKSSKVLETLPPETQTGLVARLANMQKVAPEVIVSMEKVLIERIRTQGRVVTEEIDGSSVLAEILKNMDLSDEGRILGELAEGSRELSEQVREKLFTVDTVLHVRDTDLERILRDYNDSEIAVLLKGRDEEFRNKMLYNVSRRRLEFIKQEEEVLGAMRRSDVEKALKEFLDYLRDLELQGNIVLSREKEEYI